MYEIEKENEYYTNLLLISDTHLCHNLDKISLVHKSYQYAYDHDIKYVLHLGDLIEGVMPHNKKELKIDNVEGQIEYVKENYPNYSGIKTLILFGNHDYYSLHKGGIDAAKEICDAREDLINLGYGEAYTRILDNYFRLTHDIDFMKNYKKNMDTSINIYGHVHNFKVGVYDENIHIHLPSLSYLKPNHKYNVPSIVDMKIRFYRDVIASILLECIDIEKETILSCFEIDSCLSNKKYLKIKEKFNEYNNL